MPLDTKKRHHWCSQVVTATVPKHELLTRREDNGEISYSASKELCFLMPLYLFNNSKSSTWTAIMMVNRDNDLPHPQIQILQHSFDILLPNQRRLLQNHGRIG